MIRFEALRQKPRLFRSLTNLDVDEFEEILRQLLPIWQCQEQERLSRPDRQRAIGGGRKYLLSVADMLLMTLFWLRLYLNMEALGFFWGVDKATVSRNTRRMLKALQVIGLESLGWPEPPQKGEGKTVEEALEACPDLLAVIDGTEQRVRRPKDREKQRQHYSGRRKAHTRKTVIVVNERGRIRAITPSAPGSKHDLKLTVESKVVEKIPEGIPLIGDTGFDGIQN